MKTMSMMDAVQSVLSKYATFTGRARRSEFWYWTLATFLLGLIVGAISAVLPFLAFLIRRIQLANAIEF